MSQGVGGGVKFPLFTLAGIGAHHTSLEHLGLPFTFNTFLISPSFVACDRSNLFVSTDKDILRLDLESGHVKKYSTEILDLNLAPRGMAMDEHGTLLIADVKNHRICQFSTLGVLPFAGSTFAGNEDGPLSSATFCNPYGIAIDQHRIYISDIENHCIRVIQNGVVSTLAGCSQQPGFADGHGANVKFFHPAGLALHPDGSLIVADHMNHRIRRVDANGSCTTVAGDGVRGFQDGDCASARFGCPMGVVVDREGNIYVSDLFNHSIRMISAVDNQVQTIIGDGTAGCVDGIHGRLNRPLGLFIDNRGYLYIADAGNSRVRVSNIYADPYTPLTQNHHPSTFQADLSQLFSRAFLSDSNLHTTWNNTPRTFIHA